MVNIRTSFTYLWMNVLMQCNAFFNNLILLNLYMGTFPKIHQQNPYRSLKSIYYCYVVLPNQDYVHSLTWEASKPITFSFSYKSCCGWFSPRFWPSPIVLEKPNKSSPNSCRNTGLPLQYTKLLQQATFLIVQCMHISLKEH